MSIEPAPCPALGTGATEVECYDTDAVALVDAGSTYWRDLVKEDRPALDGRSTVALILLGLFIATFVATYVRRNK